MADEKKINDIKKGLAECFMVGDGCGSCPYCKECYPAKGEPKRGLLYKDTVALIDEMQAEIERLKAEAEKAFISGQNNMLEAQAEGR